MNRDYDTYDRFTPSERGRFGDNESNDIRVMIQSAPISST